MNLTLKHDPLWLGSLIAPDSSSTLVLLSGDGHQVTVSAVLLLSASPLLRSILADLLPPAYTECFLSLPAATGDTLEVVKDILTTGTIACGNEDEVNEVRHAFWMLGVEASLVSSQVESIQVGQVLDREIKVEGEDSDLEEETIVMDFIVKTEDQTTTISQDTPSNSMEDVVKEEINADDSVLTCQVCSKHFATKKALRQQRQIHEQVLKYNCSLCHKIYTSKGTLKAHGLVHSGEKPYQCQICRKAFSKSSHLKRHNFVHTDNKPHQCTVCAKSFSQESDLTRHQKNHTKVKLHICKKCTKTFSRPETLKIHERNHAQEKPFKCNMCEYSCSDEGSLNRHKLTHTMEKPHQCNICQKSFSRASTLQSHSFLHSEEKSFKCEVCSKTFFQAQGLTIHKRSHGTENTVCIFLPDTK